MASAADQMASSISLSKFAQATDLKKRLWFTIGALIVFRLLSYVPLPGIDPTALTELANRTSGGVLDFFNAFSGGSLKRASLIALGVTPYITASIVVQLATSLSPTLAAIKKEGESGRKKLNQYTRYGTVALTIIQGYFLTLGFESQGVVVDPGFMFVAGSIVSLVGGTMFLMWIGEQITARGIGNGMSLIIMAGIVANLPTTLYNLAQGGRAGNLNGFTIVAIAVAVAGLILFICFMERAQRRILIQYPKRQTQRGMQSDRSHLPLKINTAGVIPPIFASSLLLMPLTVMQLAGKQTTGAKETWYGDLVITLNQYLQHGSLVYMLLYGAGIIFFSFFYTAVVFNPEETADNLKRHGGFIPGIRPGKNTENYFDYVLTRITVIGAGYLAIICLLPEYLVSALAIPFYLGGTSLLIVVNVTMDTVTQIQSHLLAHQYGDLIKKAKLKGGRLR